jgi:hypothetical protein
MKKALFLLVLLCSTLHFYGQSFAAGEKVMALETDNLWYNATVLETDGTKCRIHWEGYGAESDRWITNDFMWRKNDPFVVGDRLQGMETDGKWYNLKVLKKDLDTKKYFIHWGGFDEVYDRWISYDSLRLPTKENYIKAGDFVDAAQSSNSSSSSSWGSGNSSSKAVRFTLKNQSGSSIKFSYDTGSGATSSNNSQSSGSTSTYSSVVGGQLKINGQVYRTFSASDNNTTIIYK